MNSLPSDFYQRNTKKVAQELLGKVLFHQNQDGLTAGIITETEAYLGLKDPACHTFDGHRTPRVESMYKTGGHSYVYFIYGMHFCFNVVTQNEKKPEAVLIRALHPLYGLDIMRQRRQAKNTIADKNLCSGPGKLCQAMGIDRTCDGLSLQGPKLWIERHLSYQKIKKQIETNSRVGVAYAGEAQYWPLRFTIPKIQIEDLA